MYPENSYQNQDIKSTIILLNKLQTSLENHMLFPKYLFFFLFPFHFLFPFQSYTVLLLKSPVFLQPVIVPQSFLVIHALGTLMRNGQLFQGWHLNLDLSDNFQWPWCFFAFFYKNTPELILCPSQYIISRIIWCHHFLLPVMLTLTTWFRWYWLGFLTSYYYYPVTDKYLAVEDALKFCENSVCLQTFPW